MEFSSFYSSTLVLDRPLWHVWLMGIAVDSAIAVTLAQHRKRAAALGTQRPESAQIAQYVTTQFRNFETLEHFLHHPRQLHTQPLFALPFATRRFLIESYYGFDDRVFREILGRKLTSRVRKELDDVSQKTRLPIAGCRRMFDNLKRIIKRVEDSDGDMVTIIQRDFLLPSALALQYANTIFINSHRIDTSKKRLAHLRFVDLEFAASVLIRLVTASPETVLEEFDAAIAQDARDIKSILFNSKDALESLRSAITNHLVSINQPHIMERAGHNALKVTLRNILSIGSGISNSKDIRDLFGSIQEKIVDPCVAYGWSPIDLDTFLATVVALFSGPDLDAIFTSTVSFASVPLHQQIIMSHQQQSLVMPSTGSIGASLTTDTTPSNHGSMSTNAPPSLVPISVNTPTRSSSVTQQQTEIQLSDPQQSSSSPPPSHPYHHQSSSISSAIVPNASSTNGITQSPLASTPTPQPFTGITASVRRRYGNNFAKLVTAIRFAAVRFMVATLVQPS